MPGREQREKDWSELDHGEAGNVLEVAKVDCQHRIAERQCRGTDEQVRERDNHSTPLLFAVELACQQRGVFRVGIHRQVCQEFVEEGFPAKTPFRCECAIDAVNQFG